MTIGYIEFVFDNVTILEDVASSRLMKFVVKYWLVVQAAEVQVPVFYPDTLGLGGK